MACGRGSGPWATLAKDGAVVIAAITSCTNTTGTLFMVGGNLQEDNTEIWNRMVEAAGGPGVRKSGLESSRD